MTGTDRPDVSEQGWRSLAALYFCDEFVAVPETGKMVALLPGDHAFEVGDEIDELFAWGYLVEDGPDSLRLTEQGAYQIRRYLRRNNRAFRAGRLA